MTVVLYLVLAAFMSLLSLGSVRGARVEEDDGRRRPEGSGGSRRSVRGVRPAVWQGTFAGHFAAQASLGTFLVTHHKVTDCRV